MKIQTRDTEKARKICEWLKLNVGPQLPGVVGTTIHGEGWVLWVNFDVAREPLVSFEVDEAIVDRDTMLLFSLMWS